MTEEAAKPIDTDVTDKVGQIAVQAREAISSSRLASLAAQSMLTLGRLYGAAGLVLRQAVSELPEVSPEDREPVARCIAEMMREYASKPFDVAELPEQLMKVVMPLAMYEKDRIESAERKAKQSAVESHENLRRSVPVPVGFEWRPGFLGVARDKIVVFRGPENACQAARKLILRATSSASPATVTLHLADRLYENTSVTNTRNKPYVVVGKQQWFLSAETGAGTAKFLDAWLQFTKYQRVDLLLIDNALCLAKPAIVGGSRVRAAASGLRNISRWQKEAGCAVIAFAPTDEADTQSADAWASVSEHHRVVDIDYQPSDDGDLLMVDGAVVGSESEPQEKELASGELGA